ncbi:uncharacterized protein LOC127240512 [Andrographis paniculata]|uniref:uncharacterized protein LOC127240512 n=1 Tax=Andrographis paniculata TaxID=175694 RepID=UPI0021E7F719|nr:uncharacterized protein LOC127240512 [Andrographis paniculata]
MSSALHFLHPSAIFPSSLLPSIQEKKIGNFEAGFTKPRLNFKNPRFFPSIRAATNPPSSFYTGVRTELDVVQSHSEIVPDTVIFDDFERFPPTAATVSSSLILGICSLPGNQFRRDVDTALADAKCSLIEESNKRTDCFLDKALVNVGASLAKLVPGRVSTEVNIRHAYDTSGIVNKVYYLLKLYHELGLSPERLLFRIPATWQGIEASKMLESKGIQTHLTFVNSFCQAAAAAQAGTSVIQIYTGRIRDWSRCNKNDPEIEAARSMGQDPGRALVSKVYNYIHKFGYKTKMMVSAIRNEQDLFDVLGVDYIVTPVRILQSLKMSMAPLEHKYYLTRKLHPENAASCRFTIDELVKWDESNFAAAVGPGATALLIAGIEGYHDQTDRVEELLKKMWPPPNV